MWGVNEYFIIFNRLNKELQKAVEAIENNTFERLELVDK
jgi:hypothetical protein